MDEELVMTDQDILAFTKCGDLALIFFLDNQHKILYIYIMETEITKTELIQTIISEIDFLENEQLLRLYREVYGDIHDEQVDWDE